MKKNIVFALTAACFMVSCNNQSPKMDEQPLESGSEMKGALKLAYVEVDSLMTQFEFAKEKSAELEKKSINARFDMPDQQSARRGN